MRLSSLLSNTRVDNVICCGRFAPINPLLCEVSCTAIGEKPFKVIDRLPKNLEIIYHIDEE